MSNLPDNIDINHVNETLTILKDIGIKPIHLVLVILIGILIFRAHKIISAFKEWHIDYLKVKNTKTKKGKKK